MSLLLKKVFLFSNLNYLFLPSKRNITIMPIRAPAPRTSEPLDGKSYLETVRFITDLYETLYTEFKSQGATLREHFAPRATFTDPFTVCHGTEEIFSHFKLLSTILSTVGVEIHDICVALGGKVVIVDATHKVKYGRIGSIAVMGWAAIWKGLSTEYRTMTKIVLGGDEGKPKKILSVEECWSITELLGGIVPGSKYLKYLRPMVGNLIGYIAYKVQGAEIEKEIGQENSNL